MVRSRSGFAKTLLAGASLALMAQATSARAEDEPAPHSTSPDHAPSSPAEAGQSGSTDILVTANRRVEKAQNVAASLSVISGQQLGQIGASRVNDLQYSVPSLVITPQYGSGQPAYQIRGVGFQDYGSNNSATVGVSLDDTSFPIPFMTQGQLFDIERVEVLRGPQGTLYGANTTAGAINFISRKPTDRFAAGASVEYTTLGRLTAEGFVSGPLSDTLSLRLAGQVVEGGAWQRNRDDGRKLGDADRKAGRLLVDFHPTGNLRFELNVHLGRDQSDGSGLRLIQPYTASVIGVPAASSAIPADTDRNATGWGTSATFAQLAGIGRDTKPFVDNSTWGVDLRTEWTLPFATLTNIASYEWMRRREYSNYDAVSYGGGDVLFNDRAHVFGEELRLASTQADAPVTWMAGLYYSQQSLKEDFLQSYTAGYGFDADVRYGQTEEMKSAYARIDGRVTEKVHVVLGGRIETESRHLNDFQTLFYYPGLAAISAQATPVSRSTSYTLPSGKVSLEYKPVPSVLVFASASRGIKSGGFTAHFDSTPTAAGTAPFRPEKLNAFEAGVKSQFLKGAVIANLTGYYYDYHDQQVNGRTVNPSNGQFIGSVVNAPRSHMYGVEGELVLAPLAGLRLAQTAAYARGSFDHYDYVTGSSRDSTGFYVPVYTDRSGTGIELPHFTYAANLRYALDTRAGRFEPYAAFTYRSSVKSQAGADFDLKGYGLVDLGIDVHPSAPGLSGLTVSLFGRNVFNKRYDIMRSYWVTGDYIALAAPPASYGMRISYAY